MYKIQPIKIHNTKSRERIELKNLVVDQMTDQELVEVMMLIKSYMRECKENLSNIEIEFSNRMKDKHAHKYEDDKRSVEVRVNNEYDYDPEIIEELRGIVPKAMFDLVFTKSYIVNRKALKNILALGDPVREIMNRATHVKVYKPTIKVEKK